MKWSHWQWLCFNVPHLIKWSRHVLFIGRFLNVWVNNSFCYVFFFTRIEYLWLFAVTELRLATVSYHINVRHRMFVKKFLLTELRESGSAVETFFSLMHSETTLLSRKIFYSILFFCIVHLGIHWCTQRQRYCENTCSLETVSVKDITTDLTFVNVTRWGW